LTTENIQISLQNNFWLFLKVKIATLYGEFMIILSCSVMC